MTDFTTTTKHDAVTIELHVTEHTQRIEWIALAKIGGIVVADSSGYAPTYIYNFLHTDNYWPKYKSELLTDAFEAEHMLREALGVL